MPSSSAKHRRKKKRRKRRRSTSTDTSEMRRTVNLKKQLHFHMKSFFPYISHRLQIYIYIDVLKFTISIVTQPVSLWLDMFPFHAHWPGLSPLVWNAWRGGKRGKKERTPEKCHLHVGKNDDVLGGMLCGTCGEQFLHLNLLESVLNVPVMLMLHGLYLWRGWVYMWTSWNTCETWD